MLLTYLSYVGVFFLGFIVAALFRINEDDDGLDGAFQRLRNGVATESDNDALLEAAQFERDGSSLCRNEVSDGR